MQHASLEQNPRTFSDFIHDTREVVNRVGFRIGAISAMSLIALTGCAAQGGGSAESTSTPTPTPTSVEGNDLTAAQVQEIYKDCPTLESNAGYLEWFPKIPESKAKLVLYNAQISACDAAGLIVTDYGQSQSNQ